jgi:hypothetical protein
MTPIFIRIWLMKITIVFEREIEPVSLRSAWLISVPGGPAGRRPSRRRARPWGEGCDRIDHQHVDRARAHQGVGDLEPLLAGVGLGDQEVVEIDPEFSGVDRVERVLGVDKGADAAGLLCLGDGVQRQRGLAGRFGPVNLDHAAARQAPDPQRDIEPERARRHRLDLDRLLALAEPHDRAFAEGPLDLRQRRVDGLRLVLVQHGCAFNEPERRLCHESRPDDMGIAKFPTAMMPFLYPFCSPTTRTI